MNFSIPAFIALTAFLGFSSVASASGSFICQEPGGKRLIEIEGKEISKPGGKTLIYIDGNDLLLGDTHAKATLVVDDDDVRPSAAGVVIANFDGNDLRHGRSSSGKVLINYRHPDLCPTSSANRIYSIEGPEITKQQLVAGLYLLKPEMFKLSSDEIAAQEKARNEAGAEEDRLAKMDQVAGKWTVLNGYGPVEKISGGVINVSPKVTDAYPVAFDHTASGGPSWTGVGAYKVVFGDKLFWTAYGTPKTVGLCVYEIKGGTLEGTWYPWYINGDPKNIGKETLSGAEGLSGDYTITSAKAPTTGAAYSGSVSIKPKTVVGSSDNAKPYDIVWTIGTVKIYGIGIKTGNTLYVASGSGADTQIAMYTIGNGTMNCDWFKLGSNEKGGAAAMKD